MTLQLLGSLVMDKRLITGNWSATLWPGNNQLILNINKTKEVKVDFRRTRSKLNTVSVQGEEVEVVWEYRYLVVHLDNRLDWKCNPEAVYKMGQSRLYFFRKREFFDICTKMLNIFYMSEVESAVCFAAICWGSSIRARDSEKLLKKAGSVPGPALELIAKKRRMLHSLMTVLDNTAPPLCNTVMKQQSALNQRLLQLCCSTERYRRSFLLTGLTKHNNRL